MNHIIIKCPYLAFLYPPPCGREPAVPTESGLPEDDGGAAPTAAHNSFHRSWKTSLDNRTLLLTLERRWRFYFLVEFLI